MHALATTAAERVISELSDSYALLNFFLTLAVCEVQRREPSSHNQKGKNLCANIYKEQKKIFREPLSFQHSSTTTAET